MDETNSYSSLLDTPNSSLILKGPYHLNKFFDIWKYHLTKRYTQGEKFNINPQPSFIVENKGTFFSQT